jgi:hypothetical protein
MLFRRASEPLHLLEEPLPCQGEFKLHNNCSLNIVTISSHIILNMRHICLRTCQLCSVNLHLLVHCINEMRDISRFNHFSECCEYVGANAVLGRAVGSD